MTTFNLKETMERMNISIKDLNEGTGISRNTIHMMRENKTEGIKFSSLDLIMDYLDCSVFDILNIEHEPTISLEKYKENLINFIKED